MERIKLKRTPLRVLRAFRWQRAFERLMLEREQMMTLKEMAGLINDIAPIESDIFRPVTEEELKALEDDPMKGMSDVAMMYVYFMRATSTIHRADRNLGDFSDADWEHLLERIGGKKGYYFGQKLRVFNAYEKGETTITGVSISFVDSDGTKRNVSLSAAAISDDDAMDVVNMMRNSLYAIVANKYKKGIAYRKRRKMFKDMADEKIAVRTLRDELLGKSVNH